ARPDVWVRNCRTVGALFAGRTRYSPLAGSKASTIFTPASSGRYLSAGSSRPILPCSTSCISATEVTGLVIDAMRNSASVVSTRPLAESVTPNAPWYNTWSRLTTSATTPGRSLRSTAARRLASMASTLDEASGAFCASTELRPTGHLAQRMPAVARVGAHLRRPAPLFDRLRPGVAREHFGALQLVGRAVFRLALGDDSLELAADAHLQRHERGARHREQAWHLHQLGHVLGVVDLVEQGLLLGIDVHRSSKHKACFRIHFFPFAGSLPT